MKIKTKLIFLLILLIIVINSSKELLAQVVTTAWYPYGYFETAAINSGSYTAVSGEPISIGIHFSVPIIGPENESVIYIQPYAGYWNKKNNIGGFIEGFSLKKYTTFGAGISILKSIDNNFNLKIGSQYHYFGYDLISSRPNIFFNTLGLFANISDDNSLNFRPYVGIGGALGFHPELKLPLLYSKTKTLFTFHLSAGVRLWKIVDFELVLLPKVTLMFGVGYAFGK